MSAPRISVVPRSHPSTPIGRWVLTLCSLAAFSVNAVDFNANIAPVLNQRCVMCHSGENAPLGLKLDSYASVVAGSTNGPVVVTGSPTDSELIRRLRGSSLPQMPMTGPPFLSEEEVKLFEDWISTGLTEGSNSAVVPIVEPPRDNTVVTYLDVAPIFARHCVKCHTQNGLMGPAPEGYLLTSYENTLALHDRARVVAGDSRASELIRRIKGQSQPRMPFDGPPYLNQQEIALIERWIDEGARDSEGVIAPYPVGAEVRLHGLLESGNNLDGLNLLINSRTRIDKSPRPGDYVQVRGVTSTPGSIQVERLRPR